MEEKRTDCWLNGDPAWCPDSPHLPTSESLGDPTIGDVLTWHLNLCNWCWNARNDPPPAFGTMDNRKCPEYYEIITEYSEYEQWYVSKGNP